MCPKLKIQIDSWMHSKVDCTKKMLVENSIKNEVPFLSSARHTICQSRHTLNSTQSKRCTNDHKLHPRERVKRTKTVLVRHDWFRFPPRSHKTIPWFKLFKFLAISECYSCSLRQFDILPARRTWQPFRPFLSVCISRSFIRASTECLSLCVCKFSSVILSSLTVQKYPFRK